MTTIHRSFSRARGIGLITAIFILVVLAGLGVAMVSFTTTQSATVAMDVQGERAVQAARAGVEWALYENLIGGKNPCTQSFALPSNSTLAPFTVTVSCPSTATYTLNGTAVNRTSLLYVA